LGWLTYHLRSASFYWKSHLWAVLAVAVATAVLTGALVVGDSMRHSLRELAVGRLGQIDYALVAPRLFGDDLGRRLSEHLPGTAPSAILMLRGAGTHAQSRTRVGRVNILGVDQSYWALDSVTHPTSITQLEGRAIILNEPLAGELGAKVGDDVILHLGKPSAISTETLLGRRDETTATLRLTVAAILPPRGLAAFELNPRQAFPQNAFVPLEILQRALDQPEKANMLLVATSNVKDYVKSVPAIQSALAASVTLADLGLQLRFVRDLPVIESDALLIAPELEAAITRSAAGGAISPFLAYLANTISKDHPPREHPNAVIPYSTVVAVDAASPWMRELQIQTADDELTLRDGEILLNEWAANDLNAKPGDAVTLAYYISGDSGTLETRSASFTLQGVVPLRGVAADPDLVPQYKGVTDAKNLSDWDPPFPIDLKLIRDKDEEYWKEFRTTPKAFISLADGQRLWSENGDRFGRLTSIRLHPDPWTRPDWSRLSEELIKKIKLDAVGFTFQPVRQQMTASASGPTDFGTLFLSFSFFLIASAAMLVALLFRLGIEKRAFEVGLFLASGFTPRTITGVLLVEGLFVSITGTVAGLLGAGGFAWLMLAGLRSWWSAAVNAPVLTLHLKPMTFAMGAFISLLIALGTIAWSMRGLSRRSPRTLLAGWAGDELLVEARGRRRGNRLAIILIAAIMLAGIMLGTDADAMTRSLLFFASGAAALIMCLLTLAAGLRSNPRRPVVRPGVAAMLQLGMRSARRNRRRSLLTAGLIASAAFVIVSLELFRLDPATAHEKSSGSGGFSVYAESAAPLPYDLGTTAGRDNLGIAGDDPALSAMAVSSFRLRPGDESSCLNLYRPTRPRMLGANDAFIRRGGFDFAQSVAESEDEKSNPWMLVSRTFPDGAIPAIADANAVRWQYHLGLGKNLVIQDEQGQNVSLRFVALLNNSALQDEIIIADAQFNRIFPSISGHSFFLVETSGESADSLEHVLEAQLEPFGFDAATIESRLRNYFAVQNTYISTFQTLGGLGFLLGAAGLAAVLARNVWERRRELALMRTAGITRASLGTSIMAENMAIVFAGMSAGIVSALVAISPMILEGASLPLYRLTWILLSVIVLGLLAGLGAVSRALRAPLIPALRSE
jgi:putative ABC transport system permease protein